MEVILEFLRRFYLLFVPLNDTKNKSILNTTIDYNLSTKSFNVPLTNFWLVLKHLCTDNLSFRFYNLIANSFTKFLPYHIICLGI